jgi:hypothetical protein
MSVKASVQGLERINVRESKNNRSDKIALVRSEVSIYYPETIQGEKIMNLELYQQVYLNHDLPEYQLKKGDIATLIDFVPHPHNQEEGCILEYSTH